MRRLLLSVFIALLAYHPAFAQEVSVRSSCAIPRDQVEFRICNSPYANLKAVAREADIWYRRAMAASDDKEALRLEQQEWVGSLNTCLASESIDPSRYVCDSALDPAKKDECARDFCLVLRFHERNRVLHRLSTSQLPRIYLMSSEWPTGIRAGMQPMEETDRPLCWAVNSHIARPGKLFGPLLPDAKFKLPPPWPRAAAGAIGQRDILKLAQRLEIVLRKKYRHPVEPVLRQTFADLLQSRFVSGELDISIYPYAGPESEAVVLRYQRWARNTKTTPDDLYAPVEFFYSPGGKLGELLPIGSGEDVFIFRGKLFIASSSERIYDSAWRLLPLPQPELYVYKIAMEPPGKAYAVRVCHFVYSGPL